MIRSIYEWVSRAVTHIRFPPDRAPVAEELTNHYLDCRDGLIRGGMERQQAEQAALDALGDPNETGRLLNRMHRPYLGWLWVFSRYAVGLVVFLFLIGIFRYPAKAAIQSYFYGWPTFFGSETGSADLTYLKPFYDGEGQDRELKRSYGVCAQTARAGDYAVSVERAVRWQSWYEDDGVKHTYDGFRFILRAEADSLTLSGPDALRNYLTVTDSAGNSYVNVISSTGYRTDEPRLAGNPFGRALRNWYYDFWLEDLDPDIRWVDLHYDRAGVSFTLRIDLTGDAV